MRFRRQDNQEVQPGELRDLVDFTAVQEVKNGSGGRTETWPTILSTRCAMRAVKGAEEIEGNRVVARTTVLLRIRWRDDVALTAEHRANIRGVAYELTSAPQDRTGNRRTLWVEAVSV